MYQGYVNTNVQTQLASLYRREFPEDLSITVESIQLQNGDSDCGLFAAAICVALALGTNPTTLRWRQERMKEHLKSCFESKIFTQFPSIPKKTSVKPKKLEMFTIPLICICRLPVYAFKYVIQCMNCQQFYHKSCVGYEDRKGKIVNFSCFKCRKNTI